MFRSEWRVALTVCIVLSAYAVAVAEPILNHLPHDAIGFVAVRNLASTNRKIEQVERVFQHLAPQPLPAPLPTLKAATGLGPGLNEEGDALLAILPGSDGARSEPIPLLLIAVADYAAFADTISADASGEICRVTIAGQEVLAAKRGGYAALMNVDNRDRFESLLAAEAAPLRELASLDEWLARVDAAAVVTPAGVDMLAAMAREDLAREKAEMEEQLRGAQFENMLEQAQQGLAIYDKVLGFLGKKVEGAAIGLAIDDRNNVKLLTQLVLADESGTAGSVASGVSEGPFAGLPDELFVAAAGGPVSAGFSEAMAKLSRGMLETYPSVYGFESLTDDQWSTLEESWRDSMSGLRHFSLIMLPGTEEEPLYSNVYGVLKVDNSAEFLKRYARAMEVWNGLVKKSTAELKLEYKIEQVEVAGKAGVLTSADVGEAAYDENVPGVQRLMEAMFGEDGVMRTYAVAADETTVVLAVADQQRAAAAVEQALKRDRRLGSAPLVQATTGLLDQQAPWQMLISLRGGVFWVERIINTLAAHLGGRRAPDLPEFPETPPLGVSVNVTRQHFTAELVWPAETLKGLAVFLDEFIKAFMAAA
ncbi:MAG: hypothetical protein DCC67_08240 [Planctomycetota bacterium]|nr:MAG: hypothetical protein DCC67_08240 [Planctomycetota bacterium]